MSSANILHKALDDFGKKVTREAKANVNLKRGKYNLSNTGKLAKSISYNVDGRSVSFKMEKYGIFQDLGVSGTQRKFKTLFSYKDKKPPLKVFDKWVVSRGLAPRNKSGRFTSRKSIKFALQKHIFTQGIKPKYFFKKAFDKHYNELKRDFPVSLADYVSNVLNNKK